MRKVLMLPLMLLGLLGSGTAASAQPLPMNNCDLFRCYTPVMEVHSNRCGTSNTYMQVYYPPAGVRLVDVKGEVELEGGGATHYVKAVSGGQSFLKCKWHARKKCRGDNGLAKGYCWIQRADAPSFRFPWDRMSELDELDRSAYALAQTTVNAK